MAQNAHVLGPFGTLAHFGFVGSSRMFRRSVNRAPVRIMSVMNCCASSMFENDGHRSSMVAPDRAWPAMTCE